MARPVFHSLKVAEIRRETADCVSVAFDIPQELKDAYQYTSGQYLTLRSTIDGQDIRRSYSICSAPFENYCRVAIKQVEGGVFSTWANEQLKEGDELQVMTPMGSFVPELGVDNRKHYVLVGAGSGVTPLISIAKSVLKEEPKSEVSMILGNRQFQSIIFRDELEDLKDLNLGRFRVFHVLSGEPNDISLLHGRVNNEKLEGFMTTFLANSPVDAVFLCGPQIMTEAARDFFVAKGVPEDDVHLELFGTALPQGAAKKAEVIVDAADMCEVSVIYDGQQTDFKMSKGAMVLDEAQKAGLDIPYSCKGGMCCTCRAKVVEGEANMAVNYALEPGEVNAGYVLTCQAHPVSSKLVVDFDQ
jgi:ring-1,2-phenylacetyl-CoA epoxidase subunit PaaE